MSKTQERKFIIVAELKGLKIEYYEREKQEVVMNILSKARQLIHDEINKHEDIRYCEGGILITGTMI